MKKIVLLVTLGLLTGQSAYAEETTSVPAAQVSSSEMGLPELSDSINEGGTAQETMTSAPDPQKVKVSSEANFSLGGMTWQKVKEDNSEANIGVAYQSQGRVAFNWQYYDISQKNWVTMNANTTSNWITFKAPHAGQYLIHVYGTNEAGETKEYAIGWNVAAESISLKGMTWQTLDGLGAKANIGVSYKSNSPVIFTWQYYEIAKKEWQVIAKDTTSNWITFNAPDTGQYLIHVEAKTAGGQTATYDIGWTVETESVTLKGMTWQKVDKYGAKANIGISYQANSPVTFTWQYYDIAKKEWHIITKDTSSNWITFNAPHTGQYLIYVEAKTKGGQSATYNIGWNVTTKEERINKIISKASSYGGQKGGQPFINWYGSDPVGWCTIFVTYVFNESGMGDLVPMTHLPQTYYNYFQSKGQLYSPRSTPQVGDIAIFDWPNLPWSIGPGHTTIVDYVGADGTVRTISGNTGDYVSYYYTNYKDPNKAYGLVGFGRPDY